MSAINTKIKEHFGFGTRQLADLYSVWSRMDSIMVSGRLLHGARIEKDRHDLANIGYTEETHRLFETLVKYHILISREDLKIMMDSIKTFCEERLKSRQLELEKLALEERQLSGKISPLRPNNKAENFLLSRIFTLNERSVRECQEDIKEKSLLLRHTKSVLATKPSNVIPFPGGHQPSPYTSLGYET